MTTAEILEALERVAEDGEEILLADGFEEALLGLLEGCNHASVACYDYRKCVEILVARGMDEEEAEEYFNFNVVGAYMGKGTPLFLHRWRE